MKASIASARAASSGARRMEEGCTVASTCGASGEEIHSPRCAVTRKVRPSRACAAVEPRQTITRGRSTESSASSHGRQAWISSWFGLA